MKVGDTVDGRYLIEAELGRGSFGTVYQARQTAFDRKVALKVLLPWVSADQAMRHRFKREAQLASRLKSSHTIDIFDFAESQDGALYIVMEYLEGEPLDALLKRESRLAPERVASIGAQTLESLDEAHRIGIVHRDLKPDNIFVCNNAAQEDFVKVFDFGIAKIIGSGQGQLKETTKLTVTGGTVGTPVYMSPEQCRGQELTPASDFYSLGIVLYESMVGKVPFEDPNPVQTMMAHNSRPVPPLPPELADTPLGRAVMKSLAKLPDQRFLSAAEFRAAILGEATPVDLRSSSVSMSAASLAAAARPAGTAAPQGSIKGVQAPVAPAGGAPVSPGAAHRPSGMNPAPPAGSVKGLQAPSAPASPAGSVRVPAPKVEPQSLPGENAPAARNSRSSSTSLNMRRPKQPSEGSGTTALYVLLALVFLGLGFFIAAYFLFLQ